MSGQDAFRAGLLDPDRPAPEGVHDGSGHPAGARYDVYRNNVTHSLIAALQTAFPLVYRLIGTRAFLRAAPEYVRAHPPSSPVMMQYGHLFPAFLADYQPLARFGYLPDAARLDLAMRAAYHAADAPALGGQDLQAIPPEALMTARLSLSPSTRFLRSDWPLFDIWRYNFTGDAPKPRAEAQDVLITRLHFDPVPHLLPPGAAIWLDKLSEGHTLSTAHAAATEENQDFDLGAALTLTLATGAFSALSIEDRL